MTTLASASAAADTRTPQRSYAGTWALVRLNLRRERIPLVAWVLGMLAVAAGTFSAFQQLYPNELERQLLAVTVSANPAVLALTGPVASTSIGGMTAWRTGVILTTLIGLMAIFTVIRRTRGDEEAGRTELLASCVVGRAAPLAAAVVVAGGAGVLIGTLVTAVGIGYGQPAAGSLALGASLAGCGFLYAAVAAVAAQVAESARTATAISAALLAVGFALRSVGDVSTGARWLTWLSPQGWAQHMRAYADNQWPVLVLFVLTTSFCWRWHGRCSSAGTSDWRCCPPGTARRPTLGCPVRGGWPSGCSGGRWSAGPSDLPASAHSWVVLRPVRVTC